MPFSRRAHPVLRGTRLPRRDDLWRAAQPPHCARVHTRLCGVIKMMSLRDIAQARACRAAMVRAHAQCYQAFVPVGTWGHAWALFLPSFCPYRGICVGVGPVSTDMQRLTAFFGGIKNEELRTNGDLRTENIEPKNENRKPQTENRTPQIPKSQFPTALTP